MYVPRKLAKHQNTRNAFF